MKICISLGNNNGPSESPYTIGVLNQMVLYLMLGIIVLVAVLFFVYGVIPWVNVQMCNAAPNWQWAPGVCP